MNKFAIIISKKDKAGMNIYENLKELEIPSNVKVYLREKESIDNEDIDEEIDAEYFIFATKHQSEAKVKTLCVHAPGNFLKNEAGGKEKELNWSMGNFMKRALIKLSELNTLEDFEIAFEATHHGPFLKKPCMFIEIGSSEEEWGIKEAGKLIARVILDVVKNEEKFKGCIVLGGGHYNQVGKKLMLNSDYAVGHVCPKYHLENLSEDMLKQMIERNDEKVELVILDWKGLGKEKERIKNLLEKLKIKYERYNKIK